MFHLTFRFRFDNNLYKYKTWFLTNLEEIKSCFNKHEVKNNIKDDSVSIVVIFKLEKCPLCKIV